MIAQVAWADGADFEYEVSHFALGFNGTLLLFAKDGGELALAIPRGEWKSCRQSTFWAVGPK